MAFLAKPQRPPTRAAYPSQSNNATSYGRDDAKANRAGIAMALSPIMSDPLKFFNRDRGFGFIVNDQAGPDIFVHARDLERSGLDTFLSEGDRVEFDISADRRTQRSLATNLSIL